MGAFNGSGLFVRSFNWVTDKINSVNITASRVDTEDDGFAAGLTLCVTRDGQGKMAADFTPATDNTLNLGTGIARWTSLNGDSIANGTFTATLTGVIGTVTGTASWARIGKIATLFIPGLTGASNTTTMTITGLPAAIQPASLQLSLALPAMTNNGIGTNLVDCQIFNGSSIMTFRLQGGAAGFSNTGTKGTGAGFAVTYPLI